LAELSGSNFNPGLTFIRANPYNHCMIHHDYLFALRENGATTTMQ
jgi:hypothetical protein